MLANYADIAEAAYGDSLTTAQRLDQAIAALVKAPSDATLSGAREAWLAARVPYQQTEAFRFGNPVVDDWEGRVNSWPLDEGLIDYVDASYGSESDTNAFYVVNVIANARVTAGGETIDASTITPDLIRSLQEVGGIEANVATATTRSNFCSGAKTSTEPVPAQAIARQPITIRRTARTAIVIAARSISRRPRPFWSPISRR